jgi:hypothetical protein
MQMARVLMGIIQVLVLAAAAVEVNGYRKNEEPGWQYIAGNARCCNVRVGCV